VLLGETGVLKYSSLIALMPIGWGCPDCGQMVKDQYMEKNINGHVIIYRYGINSKSDIDVRYYRFGSCRTCWCDVYPQPVWLVVREIEIDKHSIANVSKKQN
jgi:hypothetical protein